LTLRRGESPISLGEGERALIRVRLSGALKEWTEGISSVELDSGPDVLSVVRKLDARFPGLGLRIVDDQARIRPHVNVFVNSENSKELGREKARVGDGDTVHILPAVSGG
jgi:molybdopterin converting factor small subunit